MRSVIPKRYLFLDIDGVIVTHRSLSASKEMDNFIPDMTGVNFLRKFCNKFGVDIIVSSTWRHHHKMLYQLLHDTKLIHNLLTPWDMFKSLTPMGLDMTGVNFLRKFCTKFGVDIIISSSWRHHHKMLYQLLHETKLIHNLLTPWDMFKSLTPIGLDMPSRPADNEYKSVCWGRAFVRRRTVLLKILIFLLAAHPSAM